MPVGTKVHDIFITLRAEGLSKKEAARIAQSQTGQSLKTGKKPKKKK